MKRLLPLWLLLLALLALVIWACRQALRAHRRRAPMRAALTLVEKLQADHAAGEISAEEYLHQGNAVLERLLVRALGRTEYADLSGQAWLEALNKLTDTNVFTDSASAVLGDARFARSPSKKLWRKLTEWQQLQWISAQRRRQ